MEHIIDLLKITLPALLVMLAAYLTMKRFFERQPKPSDSENKALKLKAYERLTLFMERITPEKLIHRIDAPNMNCAELQQVMLKTIRQEYEHNITQQLYVSDEAWNSVLIAKEGINQLINSSMSSVSVEAPSIDLAQTIIKAFHSTKSTPIELSIRVLKHDVVQLLN